ncbi:MAG: ferritin [Planctomycetota bacterium]|jgi:ferritin
MIPTEIQRALNEQINEEYCSWYFYRSAAAYCHEKNLTGFSKWLRHRSEKKLGQANRLTDFLLERRGHVEAKPINSANGHWDSPLSVLEAALERERQLGQSVARLVGLSMSEGDHATHDFLEGVVSDQVEAEAKVETVRERLKMVGDAPAGLFMVDRDLA